MQQHSRHAQSLRARIITQQFLITHPPLIQLLRNLSTPVVKPIRKTMHELIKVATPRILEGGFRTLLIDQVLDLPHILRHIILGIIVIRQGEMRNLEPVKFRIGKGADFRCHGYPIP